ncbi:MAG: FAD:protein FMN transferase [Verrucomicrobia bacterium]|nr:FAD:protein FMN transferase [Verrucomicrobiota bacterium]
MALLSAAELPLVTWTGETMGSTYTVKIAGTNLAPAFLDTLKKEVDDRLKEVNRQMSHYIADSELSRFNRAPPNQPLKISPEFARVLRFALDLNRRSGGAFDPTLGPVINLWGFGEKTTMRRTPSDDELRAAMKQTGCQHLTLTANNELSKDIAGLTLNLSAIAKGFGVDEMAGVLRRHGLTNLYVSISGDVFADGHNAKGQKWQVGISAPVLEWRPGDPLVTVLALSGQAVSTAGDYQRFFLNTQGRPQGHIFDPRSGRPVQHNLGSVSVVADNCLTTDALDTTLFVLGLEEGLHLIESYTNAAALFTIREADNKFRLNPSSRFTGMTGFKVADGP